MADGNLAKQPSTTGIGLSPGHSQAPQLMLVNPLSMIFDADANEQEKTLDITNKHTSRIAWRVLSNSSCRYSVTPNTGFLAPGNAVAVKISLMERATYNPAHRFIVQAMAAGKDDNDRKKIWTMNSTHLVTGATTEYVQSVRVLTEMPQKSVVSVVVKSPRNNHQSNLQDVQYASVAATKSNSNTSLDGVEDINKAHETINAAIQRKNQLAAKLTVLVNLVKQLEADVSAQDRLIEQNKKSVQNKEIEKNNLQSRIARLEEDVELVKR